MITLRHSNFLINIINYLAQIPYGPQDKCLLCLPMTAGVGIAMLTAYSYMGLETIMLPRFTAAGVLDAIEKHGVTRMFAVPTLLAAMVQEQARQPRNLSSLRLIGYGGQAAATSLILHVMDSLGCGLYQVFGASEAGGFITVGITHERPVAGEMENCFVCVSCASCCYNNHRENRRSAEI